MSSTFQTKMKMASSMWGKAREQAKAEPSFGNEIEDGRYVATISEGKMGEAQTSGRFQIAWTYVLLEGDHKGETIRSYDGLETENNLIWLGRKLARLGFEIPETLEEVQDICNKITKEKPTVRIRVKTNGEFQNVYVDQLLKGHEADNSAEYGDAETSTAEVPEEAAAEIVVGCTVKFTYKGGTLEGEVVELLEADGKLKVKSEKLVYTILNDKVEEVTSSPDVGESTDVPEEPTVEPEEEPEPEPEPARVTKRTPTPAPVAKKKPEVKKKARR